MTPSENHPSNEDEPISIVGRLPQACADVDADLFTRPRKDGFPSALICGPNIERVAREVLASEFRPNPPAWFICKPAYVPLHARVWAWLRRWVLP